MRPRSSQGSWSAIPEGSPADYGFPHEQVREFVVDTLPASRRRKIHAVIVELLGGNGEPAPESLPMLAHHARAAGDAEASARFAIEAAREALGRNAPEEVLRSVELGLPVVSEPRDRVALLLLRDDALSMLHRSSDRLEALAELTALADALTDPALSLQLQLRRSAALRDTGDCETAADVARTVRSRAAAMGDRALELAAYLELGQALLRSPLGESYVPAIAEIDADGAEEAFTGGPDPRPGRWATTGASPPPAVSWVRWRWLGYGVRISRCSWPGPFPRTCSRAPRWRRRTCRRSAASSRRSRSTSRLGDRRGLMSSILGLAYATMGADFVLSGSIRRLEEIRRLSGRLTTLATESERVQAELQLLYGDPCAGP